MIYGYARVSTVTQKNDGNSLASQQSTLREHGATDIYVDSFTGTKLERPEFTKLLSSLQSGDTLMVTKLDRISRSASQGIKLVDELLSRGISVHILNMGIMDNSPTGKLIRNIMFSFAEFERDMIVERTTEGKAIAKQKQGFREGRPKAEYPESMISEIAEKIKKGISKKAIYTEYGIPKASFYKNVLPMIQL